MAPRRGWCKLCQDDYRSGDVIIRCTTCPKSYHKECIEDDLSTNGYSCDLTNFKCENCLRYVDENAIENDERCKLCKERNRNETDILLLCDGCPNSYHLSCLDLHAEPDQDVWYCPMCKPEDFKAINVREYRRNPLSDSAEHLNSSICYVCQRHGKLLGCDFCSNSFHHGCLPEFDVGTIGDVWECPCCKGEDPFLNQMHKRWTIQQIEKNIKERRRCMLLWKSKIHRYRTRFLLAHRKDLAPFVSDKIMASLQRNFLDIGADGKRRLQKKKRNIEDLLESFEEEAAIEADKFILRAHKSVYYPSGRRMDARPLRSGVSLKPHQEDGVDWLLKSFLTGGAILSDEMGLGKTIQTLCFLSYLKLMKIDGPHLIVVPLSTVGNWLREVHRFTPHLTCIKICGSRTERLHAMEDRLAYKGLYDLYITTYETVKSEESFFVETVPRWQCLILDEAHRIKNSTGAARHSMDRIVANMRLLLTGTPLQNNAMELFTLINFIFPDVFKDSAVIDEAFTNAKNKRGGPVLADSGIKKQDLEAIKLLLSRIMLRRLKEQAITLPRKEFHDVWLPLSNVSLEWYKTLMNVRSLMQENVSIKKLLGLVIKMRIVCGHPRGIVSRPYQTDKLFEFFKQEELGLQQRIEASAALLRDLKNEEHIVASAKLTFLDKLLQQLHFENCDLVPGYTAKFNAHLKELRTSAEHKKKIRKRAAPTMELARQIEAEDPLVNFRFITRPQPTARRKHFMSSGLYETPLLSICPYQRMNVVVQAEMRERIRQQERMDTAAMAVFHDEQEEVFNENVTNANTGRVNRIINDEDNGGISANTSATNAETSPKDDSKAQTYLDANDAVIPSLVKKATMHKVLIFTQFQLVLDELESYCNCRGWKYMRLDGSTNKLIRELDIREFNNPSSPYFVYLISTRAGGLGINLTAANHVVLFDEDWNPFIDLQAIDRAHRIGQKRDVHIWKLISEWTVEERMALRREQKLRLDKLLVNTNQHEMEFEDESQAPIMTLTPAVILKMMMHGNKALQNASPTSITNELLDDLVNRGRHKPPQEFDDLALESVQQEVEMEAMGMVLEGSDYINVTEVMQQEDIQPEVPAEQNQMSSTEDEDSLIYSSAVSTGDFSVSNLFNGKGMLDPKRVKKLLAKHENREELLKQLENAGILWRSERERKRPSSMYVPESWRKRTETRQIRHETKCFCCGFPKHHKQIYRDKNDQQVEVEYGELVACFRCPKSYHKFCERLSGTVKKTWTCRWHECCLCFRKSSQCDNLLIHCSNCPTSFCYDCFPPDYTRHYVGEDYYYALTSKGLNANMQNWIFFLCSKCKIQQEKDRRRKMTREEKESQQKQQKELRSALLNTAQVTHVKKRSREDRRIYIETIKNQDTEIEQRIRDAYQRLFYPNLISQVEKRIEEARIKKEENDKAGIVKTKREVSFLSTRLPSRMLVLCDNCKLPFHNNYKYPGNCPFPKELCKVDANKVSSTENPNANDEQQTENGDGVSDGASMNVDAALKVYKRTACSKCFQTSSGKLSHSRRHCDLLTIEELQEYHNRKLKIDQAILYTKERAQTSPSDVDYSTMTHAKLKGTYFAAFEVCDKIMEECFRKAGLPTFTKTQKDSNHEQTNADEEEPQETTTSNLTSYIYSPNVQSGKAPFILPPLVLQNSNLDIAIPKKQSDTATDYVDATADAANIEENHAQRTNGNLDIRNFWSEKRRKF